MAPPIPGADAGGLSPSRVLDALRGRRSLVMADQAVSSGSNFVVTALVAGLVSESDFGAFSVALIAFQLGLGGVRAVVGEPYLSTHSVDDVAIRRAASADLLRAAVAVSAAASLVMVVAAVAIGGPVFGPLVATACAFPFLGAQDSLRHVAVVDRPRLALASDVTWLVLVVALLLVAPSGASTTWFVAAWGASGVLALAVALATMGVPLAGGNARRWLREHREMAGAFLAEVASARTLSYVVILLLGPIAGIEAIGAVRAAQTFYGPLNTLFSGIYLVLVPDGARQRDEPRLLVRFMVLASLVVTVAATAWTTVGLLLPDRVGEAVFGETWSGAERVMFPMGLAVLAGSVATGAFAGLRSLGNARASLRARLWSLPPEAVLALAGAVIGGGVGYAYGTAAATWIIAAIWWGFFLAALRGRRADARAAGDPGGGGWARPAVPDWATEGPPLPQPLPRSTR
jgi:O-antigen/teichoic acid export membrane protein